MISRVIAKRVATSLLTVMPVCSIQAGVDTPGWFDDESFPNLPGILKRVTFGSIEADFGDLDNDGHVDIVVANDGNEPLLVLWNDGTGSFLQYDLVPVPGRVAADVDMGDVDSDGDLDLVVGMADAEGAQNRLIINTGERDYSDETETRLPVSIANTRDVDFVDADGDGDLDIVEANVVILLTNEGRQNRILINDGTGHFTDETLSADSSAHRFPVDRASTRAIHAVDVDGDGDQDLVCANRTDSALWGEGYDGPQNKLWINDGKGFFADETFRLPMDEMNSRDVVSGDADGDGDPDLVFGNATGDIHDFSGGGEQNAIYINDGNGNFIDETLAEDGTAMRLPIQKSLTKSVDLVDIDLDGDLDLVTANSRGENGWLAPQPGQQNRVYINNGKGYFSDQSIVGMLRRLRLPWRVDNSYDIDLADVDADGDPDIFVAEREEQNRLYINRTLREMYQLYGSAWYLDP